MILFEYICPNRECVFHGTAKEKLMKSSSDPNPPCEHCGQQMNRLIGGGKAKHISWSTWRI